MTSALLFVLGCLCLVVAFVEPRRDWTLRLEERAESAQWVIAAALFFLGAK